MLISCQSSDFSSLRTSAPLNQNDIDIFIKYGELISDTIRKNRNNNETWKAYYSKVDAHSTLYYDFHDDEPKDLSKLLKILKNDYYEIINSIVPDELYSLFKEIGWENDGHIKLWTIYFGHKILYYKKEVHEDMAILIMVFPIMILYTLAEEDRSFIDYLKQISYQRKIIKYNKKAMGIFNKNDLNIIESNEKIDFVKFYYWRDWRE